MESIATKQNFLIATIVPQRLTDEEALKDLQEVKALIETYGGVVKDLVAQRREIHDKGMFIGRGKLEEAVEIVKEKNIAVVVLNGRVKPGQIFEIKKIFQKANPLIEVWDRVDLILQIFSLHAHTAEAKLQIELASMRLMGPSIYGMGYIMSRQGGGIGTLGVGETNTELMRRHWRDQMKKIKEKLQKHATDRERQLERRKKNGVLTVSIIGYTNAGKTSLFNLLTQKKNAVQNALFVTLDSSTGKVKLPKSKKEILVSDTIGFIRNLPANLIDAFRSTLMESIHADLLLHVIDITDSDMEKKIIVVDNVLSDLQLYNKKQIFVFNKIDNLNNINKNAITKKYEEFLPQFISVKKEEGIDKLLAVIESSLQAHAIDKTLLTNTLRRVKKIHNDNE